MTTSQLSALKTELTTDPLALGYATPIAAGNPGAVANLLNQVRIGISIKRNDIRPSEISEVIDTEDFIPAVNQNAFVAAWYESMMQSPEGVIRLVNDDGNSTRILGNLLDMFNNPSTKGTRARLQQVANRDGSRAEQLFGTGFNVNWEQVQQALNLP